MDIWIKFDSGLVNLSSLTLIGAVGNKIKMLTNQANASDMMEYKSEERAKEVVQLIQDHINAIGTNNFNNLLMVYVMPKE